MGYRPSPSQLVFIAKRQIRFYSSFAPVLTNLTAFHLAGSGLGSEKPTNEVKAKANGRHDKPTFTGFVPLVIMEWVILQMLACNKMNCSTKRVGWMVRKAGQTTG
uniref:Uncharacterized protein n=1 Tax=Anopheles farauti TaxID=69004 RepID=A0A182QS04_9DIPT